MTGSHKARRHIVAASIVALAISPVDAQTHLGDTRLPAAAAVHAPAPQQRPLTESGRRLAATMALQSRQPAGRPSAGKRCAAGVVGLSLAGMVLGIPVGWATMGAVTDDQPLNHIGRVMLIGAAVGLAAGAIICAA